MELSLKIDLTDQQYQDLMKKSFSTISETPEMTEEIRKVIASNIGDYLISHPEIINKYLGVTSPYYGRYDINCAETIKQLVQTGLEEYGKEISEATKSVLKEMMKKVDFIKIFEHFFYKAMLNGFKESMAEDIENNNRQAVITQTDIDLMKAKLGIE